MRPQAAVRATVLLVLVSVCRVSDARAVEVGRKAPEIDAAAWYNTEGLTLGSLAGKIVVVEFWATWCSPCRESIPHLKALHTKYKEKGVVIIGLSDEPAAVVRGFVASQQMSYAVGAGSTSSRAYGGGGIPHAFLVAPCGTLVWQGHPLAGLDKAIERALEKTPPASAPASAAHARYDDREMIERARTAAERLQQLIPKRRETKTKPDGFENRDLAAQEKELRAVYGAVAQAIRVASGSAAKVTRRGRNPGAPAAIVEHRKVIGSGLRKVLDEVSEYRQTFTIVAGLKKEYAALQRKLDALKKTKPPVACSRVDGGRYNGWVDRHNSVVGRCNSALHRLRLHIARLNKEDPWAACHGLLTALAKIKGPVDELCRKGLVKPNRPSAAPKAPSVPAHRVYVLKDGRSISAANVVVAGDELVIKDEKGRFHSVKRSDVARVLEAGR